MARVERRSVVEVVVLEVAPGSGWVRDRLAEFLWSNQREILQAVVRHRYVAFKSAHDTGKGHGASRAVTWWLDTREDPITTTAPTTRQVHAILWRTSARLIASATFLAASRPRTISTWGPGGKSSSPLAASRLITINRRCRGFMRWVACWRLASTTCASDDCRHRIGPTRWPSPLLVGPMLRR